MMRIDWKLAVTAFAVGAVLTLLMAADAKAYFLDGNDLHMSCQAERPRAMGFVLGVLDTAVEIEPMIDQCIPANVTAGQVTDIVCHALTNVPEVRHMPAAQISVAAISNAFPC